MRKKEGERNNCLNGPFKLLPVHCPQRAIRLCRAQLALCLRIRPVNEKEYTDGLSIALVCVLARLIAKDRMYSATRQIADFGCNAKMAGCGFAWVTRKREAMAGQRESSVPCTHKQ